MAKTQDGKKIVVVKAYKRAKKAELKRSGKLRSTAGLHRNRQDFRCS